MEIDELSETAKNIIDRAQNWNFEGDCMLLQWMEQISQNLEVRATATTESLDRLSKNVGRAAISLENTQNSLNALQYTQYVEMRCQEDDLPAKTEKDEEQPEEKPREDLLKVFLQNNLKMLHNCHEKFHFMEESDDEETDNNMSGENLIYQPRNPYNDRLLPHIYGTKLWKENWHVGLCEDGAKNYSGDEASDAYSLSSSSSGENISIDSHNTGNLSQWTSSASLNMDSTSNSKIESFIPSSTFIVPSSTMVIPLPKVKATDVILDKNQSKLSESIEDTTEANESKKKSIQHKTLNLFDDNDFKSLMSEITDKAQKKNDGFNPENHATTQRKAQKSTEIPKFDLFGSRSSSPTETQTPKVDLFSKSSSSPLMDKKLPSEIASTSTARRTNLFDSPSDEYPTIENFKPAATKKYTVNLFDDLDNSVYDRNNILSDPIPDTSRQKEKKIMISAKSLFDDDDDGDDDFLNVFGKSKSFTASTLKTNTSIPGSNDLFQKEDNNKTVLGPAIVTPSLFDDSEGDDVDFVFKPKAAVEQKNPILTEDNGKSIKKPLKDIEAQKTKKLFLDDSEDENDFIFTRTNEKNVEEKLKVSEERIDITKKFEESSKVTKLPIVEDFDDDITILIPKANKMMPTFIDSDPPELLDKPSSSTLLSKFNEVSLESNKDDGDFLSTLRSSKPIPRNRAGLFDAENFDDLSKNSFQVDKITTDISVDAPLSIEHTHDPTANITHNLINESSSRSSLKSNENMNFGTAAQEIPILTTQQDSHTIKDTLPSEKPASITQLEQEESEGKQNERTEAPTINEPKAEPPKDEKLSNKKRETVSSTQAQTDSTKATKFDSFSALFLDEPPDDDDFFQAVGGTMSGTQSNFEHDFFEETKETPKTNNEKPETQPQKPHSYDVGLFSEIPPEDDGSIDEFLQPAKRIQPTILPSNLKEKDTIQTTASLHTKPIDVEKTPERDTSITHKQPITSTEKNSESDIPQKTTVSKLKIPNININVQALLPNAAGKSKKSNNDAPLLTSDNRPFPVESIPKIQEITSSKEPRLEAGRENILSSLCKNRVRGPLKRRASTRTGRKESYQKTLENEQQEEIGEQISGRSASKSLRVNKENEGLETLKEKKHNSSNLEIKNTLSKPLDSTPKSPQLIEIPKQTNIPKKEPLSGTLVKPISNLFDDFDDKESNDDFFSSIIKPKSSNPVAKNVAAQKHFPTHSESDDDLFESTTISATAKLSNKEPPKTSQIGSAPPSTANDQPPAKRSDVLFGSDSNDDDDELFRALSKPKQKTIDKASSIKPNVGKGKSKSLFSDSENDDDDLFGSSVAKTKKSGAAKDSTAPTTKNTSNQPQQSSTAKTKASVAKTTDNPLADLLN